MGNHENMEFNELEQCINDLAAVLAKIEAIKDREPFRCRSLSIAFTELETADMWLLRSLSDYDERKYKESEAA